MTVGRGRWSEATNVFIFSLSTQTMTQVLSPSLLRINLIEFMTSGRKLEASREGSTRRIYVSLHAKRLHAWDHFSNKPKHFELFVVLK